MVWKETYIVQASFLVLMRWETSAVSSSCSGDSGTWQAGSCPWMNERASYTRQSWRALVLVEWNRRFIVHKNMNVFIRRCSDDRKDFFLFFIIIIIIFTWTASFYSNIVLCKTARYSRVHIKLFCWNCFTLVNKVIQHVTCFTFIFTPFTLCAQLVVTCIVHFFRMT